MRNGYNEGWEIRSAGGGSMLHTVKLSLTDRTTLDSCQPSAETVQCDSLSEPQRADQLNEECTRRNMGEKSKSVYSAKAGPSKFHCLMSKSKLPPPGPSYYEARRTLWLIPSGELITPASSSPSRIKLEALLSQEGAVENEEVWKSGLKNVWMGLVGGNRLRKRLPLNIVIKILQAGWLRDGTWPRGEIVLESDLDDTGLPTNELATPLSSTLMATESTSTSAATAEHPGDMRCASEDGIEEGE